MTNKYVISTRVRFARNLEDYPFASRMDSTSAAEIVERVRGVLTDYTETSFESLSRTEAMCYRDSRRVSEQFLRSRYAHSLFSQGDSEVMVCEEDHLRVQCIRTGLDIDGCLRGAQRVCRRLEAGLKIAFHPELGYLTHCPSNLGTGMRISVMMFLPALSISGGMKSVRDQLGKMGLTVRGYYGEGSSEIGYLYQISNQVSLGVGEEETAAKLAGMVDQLISLEQRTAEALEHERGEQLADSAWRALGTLRHARLLDAEEYMKLYGALRFGVCMGYIDGMGEDTLKTLDTLTVDVQPATLAISMKEGAADPGARDKARAAKVRGELA